MDLNIQEIVALASSSGLTAFVGYKIKNWLIVRKTNEFKMQEHQLFITLKRAKNEVDKWNVPENKLVLKDALKIKLVSWYDMGLELCELIEKNKRVSDNQIEKTINIWAEDVINDYTKTWQEIQIPKEVIRIIENKHQQKVDLFLNTLNNIAHNNVYITWKLKYIAIFDALNVLLSETKNDFNDLINNPFNGKTQGIYYKKIPINDMDYKQFLARKHKS